MGIVGCLQLLPGSLADGLRREGWCNEHDRGEQGSGTERHNGVAHDDLGRGRGDNVTPTPTCTPAWRAATATGDAGHISVTARTVSSPPLAGRVVERARGRTLRPPDPQFPGGHMKGMPPRTALALAVITACLAGGPFAQHPQQPQLRHGFWFSGGLGYGSLGCKDCGSREGALSGNISLGGTLRQKVLPGLST